MGRCRQAAVFALILLLVAPWIAVAEPHRADRASRERSTLSAFEVLSRVSSFLTSLWEAERADVDPLGRLAPTTDEGPDPDPLGAPTTDEGPDLDPLGR
jgi:hypothetical protein